MPRSGRAISDSRVRSSTKASSERASDTAMPEAAISSRAVAEWASCIRSPAQEGFGERSEQLGLVLRGQGASQLVQIAVQDLLDLVQGQVDPVVGDPALREVVGADASRAIAASDQRASLTGLLLLLISELSVLDPRCQHFHGPFAILVLRTVVLAFHHDPGRQVRDAYGRLGLVHVLTTRPRGSKHVDPDLGRIDLDVVDLVSLGQHGNGASRCVDPSLCLGLGHTLNPVSSRFEFQAAVGALADDTY